jgi:hypothetical protein
MISDVDIRDWQKVASEKKSRTPAFERLFVAMPFLMMAMANEYIWTIYSMYTRDIGARRRGS